MTDAEVIAKVRAAAEYTLARYGKCGGCLGDVPVVDGRHDWRGGGMVNCTSVTPPMEVISARAALALVEQWQHWRDIADEKAKVAVDRYADDSPMAAHDAQDESDAAEEHAARILASLRKAVG